MTLLLLLQWLTGSFLVFGLARFLLLPRPLPDIPYDENAGQRVLGDFPGVWRCIKHEGGSTTRYWAKLATLHGPLVQTFLTRFFPLVILSDYAEIEDILTRRTHEFDRPRWFKQYFGNITPTAQSALPTNAMLKRHRRIVGQAMGQPFLSRSTHRLARAAADLMELWSAKVRCAEGRSFDVRQDFVMALIDQSFDVAFGCQLGELQRYRQHIDRPLQINAQGGIKDWGFQRSELSMAVSLVTIGSAQLRPDLVHRFNRANRPSWKAACKLVLGWMDQRIAQVSAGAEGRDLSEEKAQSVLEMLVYESIKSKSNALPEDEMRDELFQFGVAGGETTRIALCFAVKFLARSPDVQHKLRQTLVAHLAPLHERWPTFEEITDPSLAYLDAVVHEVLRCSCIAAGTLRVATTDTRVLDYAIPKGTTLYLNFGGNMEGSAPQARASTRQWQDGHLFRPERWLTAEGHFDPKSGPWMVFSAGPRACFGRNLAVLGLKVFVATISLTFFLDRIPPDLDTDRCKETHIREPVEAYVQPRRWSEFE